jgi:hypothetical protein
MMTTEGMTEMTFRLWFGFAGALLMVFNFPVFFFF